jgi:hypothetical protein
MAIDGRRDKKMAMADKLRAWLGCSVQAANALEVIEGKLVSVDDMQLTLLTSGDSGYENGKHMMMQMRFISYVRQISNDREGG